MINNMEKSDCSWIIYNIEDIAITKLEIRLASQDLTLVESELVVMKVLRYSRTQQTEWRNEGVFPVSGHRHL